MIVDDRYNRMKSSVNRLVDMTPEEHAELRLLVIEAMSTTLAFLTCIGPEP